MQCFVHFDLEMCFAPQRRALFQHPNLQKARTCGVLYIFTWKCASRHNGVHFFNIRTSKSGANMWCFVHFDLEMCFAPQRRALFQHPNLQKWRATTTYTFSTSQLPKVVLHWCVLYILTSKCASRHNGVHLFDISTAKSGPKLVCFVHCDFEMCFAPQRRALFRHLNFQKWSEHGVLCAFWLQNVLRATTACKFSSLIWPAGSAPAALASLLFDPPEPQIIGKTQCFATFLPFRASASSFFWLFLFCSSTLSLLSASSLLCFSSVHIVGSLTSKLPSITPVTSLSIILWLYPFFSVKLSPHLNLPASERSVYHGASHLASDRNVLWVLREKRGCALLSYHIV